MNSVSILNFNSKLRRHIDFQISILTRLYCTSELISSSDRDKDMLILFTVQCCACSLLCHALFCKAKEQKAANE